MDIFFKVDKEEILDEFHQNISYVALTLKDVRVQNFPHTDFVKTLTAGRE